MSDGSRNERRVTYCSVRDPVSEKRTSYSGVGRPRFSAGHRTPPWEHFTPVTTANPPRPRPAPSYPGDSSPFVVLVTQSRFSRGWFARWFITYGAVHALSHAWRIALLDRSAIALAKRTARRWKRRISCDISLSMETALSAEIYRYMYIYISLFFLLFICLSQESV